eukprot:1159226-Pelagomonas_calceolata.AAC.4
MLLLLAAASCLRAQAASCFAVLLLLPRALRAPLVLPSLFTGIKHGMLAATMGSASELLDNTLDAMCACPLRACHADEGSMPVARACPAAALPTALSTHQARHRLGAWLLMVSIAVGPNCPRAAAAAAPSAAASVCGPLC